MSADYPNSRQSKQTVMSFFGHHIEDKDVLNAFKENGKDTQKSSIFAKLSMLIKLPWIILKGPTKLIKDVNYFMHENRYNMVDKIKHNNKPKDILNTFFNEHLSMSDVTMSNHSAATMGSTVKTMLLRMALEGAQSNLFDLFNRLLKFFS